MIKKDVVTYLPKYVFKKQKFDNLENIMLFKYNRIDILNGKFRI